MTEEERRMKEEEKLQKALSQLKICPLLQALCRQDCNFYIESSTKPEANRVEKLAHHYGNCWIRYYIMIVARTRG